MPEGSEATPQELLNKFAQAPLADIPLTVFRQYADPSVMRTSEGLVFGEVMKSRHCSLVLLSTGLQTTLTLYEKNLDEAVKLSEVLKVGTILSDLKPLAHLKSGVVPTGARFAFGSQQTYGFGLELSRNRYSLPHHQNSLDLALDITSAFSHRVRQFYAVIQTAQPTWWSDQPRPNPVLA